MNKTTIHSIIKTKDLSIGYQQKKQQLIVAKNINITINQATFTALIGKNGVGKSTLLRTLTKVQQPLSGNVYLKNKSISAYSHKELATELSLVLTDGLPESQLTVFELIALGRQPYTNWIDKLQANDISKINWAIEQTEITHLKDKKFYELSDGQLQRVMIARALAQDTEIIILDEPTAHLDMHHTYKIFLLLKKLVATTGKTILISTHQINLALELVDELIVMKSNSIASGRTQDIIESNALETLFPKDILRFNKTLQQFTVNKKN
ncbi:MAG: ABC transporter ATP-binding protein [Flavobacteriaceae bacterium]|nr:ABC transporter ATP-binding protein [Flavobacteriaceae bacterium]